MAATRTAPPSALAATPLARFAADNPTFVPLLMCVGVFVWFAGDEGGFKGTTFLPAALLLGALLMVFLGALPRPRPTKLVLAAVTLFAAYAVWSYLSVLWAEQQGIAWDGANRTVLYALILALFALWPVRGTAAAALLGAWGLGVAGVGLVELLRAEAASQTIQYFHEARLSEPAGYANANVALWFSAFWPCVVLAGRRQVHPALRGLFLAAAVLLAGLAVLGESRGWLFILPVTLLLAVVLVPGRGRTIVTLVAVGAGVALVLGPLLDVYDSLRPLRPPGATFSHAVLLLLAASAAMGLIGCGVGLLETTVRVPAATARRISAGLAAVLAGALLVGAGVYTVVKQNPVSAVADKWNDFKKGGTEPHFGKSRFETSFKTYRYDYWRIAWREFTREPLVGVGVDNFQHDYLQQGQSDQTPTYPHSTVLRALSETGLVGGLLFFGAVAAALAAAFRAVRRTDLAGAAAGAGLITFAYWVVHGSLDWLWEFPGLGGPAIAGLGLAMAVGQPWRPPAPGGDQLLGSRWRAALAGGIALAVAAGLTVPWLAERDLRSARGIAGSDPAVALGRLDRSARLNPLSPLPDSTAGVIRVRQGDLPGAQREFQQALERDSEDPFSTLMLAAIASNGGRREQALQLAARAHRLAPKDAVVRQELRRLRRGGTLRPASIEAAFRRDIDVRIGPG